MDEIEDIVYWKNWMSKKTAKDPFEKFRNHSYECCGIVRKELGAPSLIADLAYVVACGDPIETERIAKKIKEILSKEEKNV